MAKVRKCPDCGCVMKNTAWNFEDDVGATQGTGDFDCRNCDYVSSNDDEAKYYSVPGYSTELFQDVPEDMSFQDFLEKYEDRIEKASTF